MPVFSRRTQTNQWQRKRIPHWLSTRAAHPLPSQKANIIHLSLTDAQHTYHLVGIGELNREPQDYLNSNFTGSSSYVFYWGIFQNIVNGKKSVHGPLVSVRFDLNAFISFFYKCLIKVGAWARSCVSWGCASDARDRCDWSQSFKTKLEYKLRIAQSWI